MASISLEQVTKRFGDLTAVDHLTLHVEDRELLVLLGPTGAGKTTTLRCIAGLETPESGHIYIGETCVDQWTPAERDVAFVFQSHVLYPHLTVFENIAFPLHPRKLAESEIREKVIAVAETLHISHLLERKPAQLSGGEIQRVGLGRAMVRDPRVYLMDEPLTNLDAKLRAEMRAELKWRHRQMGVTTFYVTHDQVEAMTMGDRVAVLREGRLQQLAPPMEVYDHPANLFVAGLVGNPGMNLLPATLVSEEGSLRIRLKGTPWTIPLTPNETQRIQVSASAREWVFGVRPEDVEVRTEAPLQGSVYAVEPLGAETYIDISIGEAESSGKEQLLRARMGAFARYEQGATVRFQFAEGRTHLFNGETGEAVF